VEVGRSLLLGEQLCSGRSRLASGDGNANNWSVIWLWGDMTHAQLGEKYGKAEQNINNFTHRNNAEIAERRRQLGSELTGLWMAAKETGCGVPAEIRGPSGLIMRHWG
jgi:hypothetical protein